MSCFKWLIIVSNPFKEALRVRGECKPLPTEATEGLQMRPIPSNGRPAADMIMMAMMISMKCRSDDVSVHYQACAF